MRQAVDDKTLVTRKTWQETTGRGDVTELAVALALVRRGRKVLRPISSATRYDLLIDNEDGTFVRIQCKTGRLRDGCVQFNAFSVSGHNTIGKHYEGEIDAFGVHCPQTGATYLIPVSAMSSRSVGTLRLSPPRNGQQRRIRYAEEFLIERGGPYLLEVSADAGGLPRDLTRIEPTRAERSSASLR